jgi:tetratricopeptide (TPR) repeat protein/Zn-dependent membrane protease YugP
VGPAAELWLDTESNLTMRAKLMFLGDWDGGFYWILALAACLGAIVAARGKHYLQRTVGQFGAVPASCGLTGALAARRLLAAVGLTPVTVVRSNWLNCYHPRKRQVQLLDLTFDGSTIASLAIAAHEVGHAQQFAGGYWPARMRLWMRPVYYGLLLAMLGTLGLCFTYLAPFWASAVVVGVAFVVSLLQLPTVLPLEYDASRRAKELVKKEGLLAPYEESSFDRLLRAASRTYLAWECQRWIMLLAGGAAVFWITPAPGHNPASELSDMEQIAAADPPGQHHPFAAGLQGPPAPTDHRENMPPAVEPGAWGVAPQPLDPEFLPSIDLTYALLSSLGTLIPAGLMVFFLAKFAQTPRRRPTAHETAVARNNAGLGLLHRGELAAAVEAFSSSLELDRNLHAVSFNRGNCYLRLGQLDEAMADIETCLRMNPHFVEAVALRAQIWTRRGKFDLALADLNQALQMAPKNAVALTCRGNLWLVQSDYDRARADFDQAIANDTSQGSAYLGRAKIEVARGNIDAALADCCQAFALGADLGDTHSVRGRIWLDKGDYDRAIADLTACLKYFPKESWVLSNRGLAHYLKGDYPHALDDLNKALELDPAEAFAYNNRGAAYLKTGNFAAATADLQKALELKPDFPNPHKHLAWLQATCPLPDFRNGTSAVAHAERALELAGGKGAEYLAVLAAAYAEAGDFSKAVECQSRCLQASPPESLPQMQERLKLFESRQPFRDQQELPR